MITYVLSHDHVSIDGSQFLSDHADLFTGDVVGVNEHNVVVFSCDILESKPVGLLLDSLI